MSVHATSRDGVKFATFLSLSYYSFPATFNSKHTNIIQISRHTYIYFFNVRLLHPSHGQSAQAAPPRQARSPCPHQAQSRSCEGAAIHRQEPSQRNRATQCRERFNDIALHNAKNASDDVALPNYRTRCPAEAIAACKCTAPKCGWAHKAQIDAFPSEVIDALQINRREARREKFRGA